jgi:hypothetical protein
MKGSILLAIIFEFYNFCSGMHENPTVYSLANNFCVSMRGRVYRLISWSRGQAFIRCDADTTGKTL